MGNMIYLKDYQKPTDRTVDGSLPPRIVDSLRRINKLMDEIRKLAVETRPWDVDERSENISLV